MTTNVKLGNQHPTQSVIIPFTKSLYKPAIKNYERSGRTAQEWQVDLAKDLFAVNDDGLWVHTKFGYSIPRRNGKTELIVIREIQGLLDGEQILHTAHRTTTSHSSWERVLKILDKAGIKYKSLKAVGRERIDIPETGGRVEFRTRTSTGGLGEGFDLLVIDEAQEYTTDQESALKYVVTDSDNPQTIFCGTPPTPLSSGTVFVSYRNGVLEGKLENAGWAEWSVEEQSNIRDRDLWYKTNPSLGTIFTERSIQDEVGQDEVDFNIQRLGLWIKYNQKSVISENEWDELKVHSLPILQGPLYVGIKYGNDGANVAMSIAVHTLSGKVFVESIDCQSVRNGNQWILKFLRTADIQQVVIDGQSGQSILAADMKDFRLKTPILPTVKEVINANSLWEQGIYQQSICHSDQPSLKVVATNSEKRNIGSSGGFGYKSQFDDTDISLMDSALLAHWACSIDKPKKKQQVRY
ncbi:terminase large subunit [Companilactobacillus nodensis]|uniref:Phage terminase n=1 Tax=Companilactobacillus nodensis DSM 19682 = JCM 14932 = NBRC 107160 TaxID=1423775 RepID=A0A0R1K5G5_9LACO|nr:terminase large subunit [Companilactobacillus nodensis]KRK78491.1 phage terminase [Companilactobacillus nodensis DSM 19682 = JCM 14932 = NBRC 107160]